MRRFIAPVVLLAALGLCLSLWKAGNHSADDSVLYQGAYVWQRSWTEPVLQSLTNHARDFSLFVILAAEVNWQRSEPKVTRANLPTALRELNEHLVLGPHNVAIALRIGSFSGPFQTNSPQTQFIADLAQSLLAEFTTNNFPPVELQIDFDCAESKLDGYRVWVEAIRRKMRWTSTSVTISITALPSWLKRPAFKRLVASADDFVLQVHSLDRPKTINAPFSLCDPKAASRAIEIAGRLNKPFSVALPTYGYVLAFDSKGRFVGLSAEGPSPAWPEGVQFREVRADPEAMAKLVFSLKSSHPKYMRGIMWYRLPVETDTLNWRWPTLQAVMDGKIPRAHLRVEARHPQPGLIEVDLLNVGQAGSATNVNVVVRWKNVRLVAADGLQGFESMESGPDFLRLKSGPNLGHIDPGERRMIGWLRLEKEAEVQVELEAKHD